MVWNKISEGLPPKNIYFIVADPLKGVVNVSGMQAFFNAEGDSFSNEYSLYEPEDGFCLQRHSLPNLQGWKYWMEIPNPQKQFGEYVGE